MQLLQRMLTALRPQRHELEHDDVAALLGRMRRWQERANEHDPNPNRGYATPFDGGQYPGINPGGPF
jgi:hypothetical protein